MEIQGLEVGFGVSLFNFIGEFIVTLMSIFVCKMHRELAPPFPELKEGVVIEDFKIVSRIYIT